MAYGLIVKNASGTTVLDTSSTVLNFETIDIAPVTLSGGSSASFTIEDLDMPDTLIVDLNGFGSTDVETTRSGTTLTLTNTSSSSRTVVIQLWRLQ